MNSGFIALTAVILMSIGVLTYAVVASSAALAYSDTVLRQELRIQARNNASSCLESLTIMLAKDYFLNGNIQIDEFGCEASVTSDLRGGRALFKVAAAENQVKAYGTRAVSFSGDHLIVTSEDIR